jgi:protein TonB
MDRAHRSERMLVAIACSIALHLGLLALLPALIESARRAAAPNPPALSARLVEQKAKEPPRLAEPAPEPPRPAPKLARPPAPKAAPRAREPAAPPVIAVPPAPSAPRAAVVPAPRPAPPAPPVASAPPAAPPSPVASAGPDPGSVAQFRLELIEAARRHKRYPRVAVDNNWEGKVDLRLVIAANGSIASLSVRRSAGYAALDDEAQKMFRTAKAELAIPPALRGKEFSVDVSADFYFKE